MKLGDPVGNKESTNALSTAFIAVPLGLVVLAFFLFGGSLSSSPGDIGFGIGFVLLMFFAIIGLIVATVAAAARDTYVSAKAISEGNTGKSRAVGNIFLVIVAVIIGAWIILLEKADFIAKMWQMLGVALAYAVIKSVWFLVDSYRGNRPMAERILPWTTVAIGICIVIGLVFNYMNPLPPVG